MQKAEQNTYWCWFAAVREDYQGKGICHRMFNMVYDKVNLSILVHFGGQLTSCWMRVGQSDRCDYGIAHVPGGKCKSRPRLELIDVVDAYLNRSQSTRGWG